MKTPQTTSGIPRRYAVDPQTLRIYEREGLLKPSLRAGNRRVYTESDIKRLEVILHLTRDLGVNLAGVEIILDMREKMGRIQSQVAEFVSTLNREFAANPPRLHKLFNSQLSGGGPERREVAST